MNDKFNNIDRIISDLNECKNKISLMIVDNQDSVSNITQKIDSIIKKLSDANAYMRKNKASMDSKKKWN
ncbi:MAG TPA: hypothetical protein DCE23_00140 [Firmicutes bacterium]|nr:hypothetical protein [Bacillota bacterium]